LCLAACQPAGPSQVQSVDPPLPEGILAGGGHGATVEDAALEEAILSAVQAEPGQAAEITVDYPIDGSIFPPEMVAPTFLWHDDSPQTGRWLIDVALAGGEAHIYVLTEGDPPAKGKDDPRCFGATNEPYVPTEYQASARSWTPSQEVWEAVKARSIEQEATVTILGLTRDPARVVSRGKATLTTSADPVGAPIFYRDVPLMPDKTEEGVIKPLIPRALPLIEWRLKDISRSDSRIVLTDMPTCGNCHSFSADGATLGMDIDGPTGDKGAYAIADIERDMSITPDEIITWNSFPDKPEGHKTIGFGSQVSPDGRYAITTVNESVYVRNFLDYHFLQVFYPTRGILAYYDRRTGEMKALPGADDTQYVHCDPVWSPDGETIVFARATARDSREPGRPFPARANDPNELPMQYDLYRMPFGDGEGETPELIEGASENGMSNTFPKVSPDGKWIVFVKCRNGQLMRPDSRLWIVPVAGGEAREMTCNTPLMNSWHSFSPNGRWMVFSSKANTPYTQMFLTHIDEDGNDSPPVLIPNATADNRAVNIPEFVKIDYDDLHSIRTPTVEYYRHFTHGNELMMGGQFVEAVAEFEKALALEPTSTRINNNLAVCLTYLGRVDEAIERYRRSLQTNPNDTVAMVNLGGILAKLGRTDEASELLAGALAADPDSVDAHLGMAGLMADQGNTDQAIQWCQEALAIDPAAATAHDILGQVYYQAGMIDQAAASWRKAIEVDPSYAAAYTSLGSALTRQGRQDEAIELYRKALEVAPRDIYAMNNLGIALARQGQVDEAIELFTRALEINPNYSVARRNLELARQQNSR